MSLTDNRILKWLYKQMNTDAYRAGTPGLLQRSRHPAVTQAMVDEFGGVREFLAQAREIEADPELAASGGISFDWINLGADIKKIHYSFAVMPVVCRKLDMEDPREQQLLMKKQLLRYASEIQGTYLEAYYEKEQDLLERGKCSDTFRKDITEGEFFRCLNEIPQLVEPVEKRIFSARVFGSAAGIPPSKVFEKVYQTRVIGVLKDYSPEYEEGMSADEVLAAHNILSYAQTLEWKGAVDYVLDCGVESLTCDVEAEFGSRVIHTGENRYGTIINSQTLEHARPVGLPGVRQIMIIENKAVYERMEYREDTLYIYCHGFFSPKEIRFLRAVEEIRTDSDNEISVLHWGDLDYGGIRIFGFNKQKIFPELVPYRMGVSDYLKALEDGAGTALAEDKRKKLAKMESGVLSDLRDTILEYGMEIEQELIV